MKQVDAQATVSSVKLIPDTFGDLSVEHSSSRDPIPLHYHLWFTVGTKTFKLTSSSTNETPLKGSLIISSAETTYDATGGSVRIAERNVTVLYLEVIH